MKTTAPLLILRFSVPIGAVAAVQDILEANDGHAALSVSATRQDAGTWEVSALCASETALSVVQDLIGAVADAFGFAPPPIMTEPLQERDWIAESLRGLAPVHAGQFSIVGSHDAERHGRNRRQLVIDAAQAFGTGHHETTRGCLEALAWLARRRTFRRPFDLGCGTGVLAMAAAATWHVAVLASDIDPCATAIARANAKRNGLANFVSIVTAPGFGHPEIRRRAPFDLILANILARPLASMAPAVARHLASDGVVVLSGLLRQQEAQVLCAYRSQGLFLDHRFVLGDWPTLLLQRPALALPTPEGHRRYLS